MRLRDYYKILKLPYNTTPEEIRSAYLRLAKEHHPDISDDRHAESWMKLINEAYAVLRDPFRKAAYDYIFFGFVALFS